MTGIEQTQRSIEDTAHENLVQTRNALRLAIGVLDKQYRLLQANSYLNTLLDCANDLYLDQGILRFDNAYTQSTFYQSVADSRATRQEHSTFLVVNQSFSKMQVSTNYPLPGNDDFEFIRVVIDTGIQSKQPNAAFFSARWDLSDKEARIAEKLVSDISLRSIGKELNLSYETIRWYVKSFSNRFSLSGRLAFILMAYEEFSRFRI